MIMKAERDDGDGDDIFPIESLGVSTSEKNTNQAQFELDHLTYKGKERHYKDILVCFIHNLLEHQYYCIFS